MELKNYLLFVWRWAWLIIICGLIGAGVGYAYSQTQPRLYAASTMLMVNQDQGNFARPSPTFDDLRARERYSLTVRQLLLVRPVLERAASMVEGVTAAQLAVRASTADVGKTELFLLTVQDTDRQRAVVLADAIVASFQALERDLLDNPYAQDSSLIVVDPAYAKRNPVSPDYARNITLSVFIAILIALTIGFLYDYFNTRIGDEGDLDRRGGGRPLVAIGKLKGASPAAQLVTLNDPTSPEAEAYRMFRLHLDALAATSQLQLIAVISAAAREGRSVTAANLSVALAQTGRRVILVDANLRNPILHTFFNLPNQGGLSNLLSGTAQVIEPFLRVTTQPGLYLLTAGNVAGLPSQLLGGSNLEKVLTSLRQYAEIIIIDSAPLLSFADTTLLLRAVDTTLAVVRSGQTTESELRQMIDLLRQTDIPCMGIAFNGVKRRWRRFPLLAPQRSRLSTQAPVANRSEIVGEVGD
ncbi:polysaccharide biosynthesis tyrosine autokinase [Chloroflexus sp.]|uniref:polysaccharide biosynthesis tyrosine autokinase n=1 Tax=Chloroflexus sp. TaxID=1904827 RepID=UPI002614A846|nr:polysaccharide biosynthesis tyrosine autokinase [uncultured Chloroflexus sp.]